MYVFNKLKSLKTNNRCAFIGWFVSERRSACKEADILYQHVSTVATNKMLVHTLIVDATTTYYVYWPYESRAFTALELAVSQLGGGG